MVRAKDIAKERKANKMKNPSEGYEAMSFSRIACYSIDLINPK